MAPTISLQIAEGRTIEPHSALKRTDYLTLLQLDAAVGLLVLQEVVEDVTGPDVLDQPTEVVFLRSSQMSLKVDDVFNFIFLGIEAKGSGVEGGEVVSDAYRKLIPDRADAFGHLGGRLHF